MNAETYHRLSQGDISTIAKPQAPVAKGQVFYFSGTRCIVTALGDDRFEYEVSNLGIRNERVKANYIMYRYWNKYAYEKQHSWHLPKGKG